jgi:HPt (histidine-containing phosphotransfer) domain-containing protein
MGLAVSGFKKLAGVKEDKSQAEEKAPEPADEKPGYEEIKQQKMASRPRQPGSMDESVTHIIDRDMVIGLKNDLGVETMRELLREMLDQAEKLLLDIRHEIDDSHIARMRAKAHSLKGMSANFGLVKLAAVASEIEEAGKHEDLNAASDYHAQALKIYDATEQALENIVMKK